AETVTREKSAFRAEDFEGSSNLLLPDRTAPVVYALLDPRGREVAGGTLGLNDYGTAAGKAQLNGEAATGLYSLRITIAGLVRIGTKVFGVRYYRRPNSELRVSGVPAKVEKVDDLRIELSGRYYFGKPVEGGQVQARLVRPDEGKPLAEAEGTLNAA